MKIGDTPFMRICNPHDLNIRIFNPPSLTDDKCCNCACCAVSWVSDYKS